MLGFYIAKFTVIRRGSLISANVELKLIVKLAVPLLQKEEDATKKDHKTVYLRKIMTNALVC